MMKQKSSVKIKRYIMQFLMVSKLLMVKIKTTPEAIPSILSEALGVAFDQSVGHDYVEDGLRTI